MARRLQAMGQANYVDGFAVRCHEDTLDVPLRWRKPQMFDVMARAGQHRFQVLTKRAERLEELGPHLDWPPNVWMGVSVETERFTWRIDHLRNTDAAVKFLSLEPLLGAIPELDLTEIDWVIVGGESGPGARPMDEAWVVYTHIRLSACRQARRFWNRVSNAMLSGIDTPAAVRMCLTGAGWDCNKPDREQP